MQRLSISEAFEIYRTDYIVFKNQSSKTEENHLICCRALLSYVGDVPLDTLTFETIRDWKNHLSKKRAQATVRNYIIKLRVVLRYVKKRGYTCLDPDTIPVPQRADVVAQYVTAEEVVHMIASFQTLRISKLCKARGMALISLLYGSGIRLSELISLDRSQIINNSFTVVGKGGKARLCFVDTRTSALLQTYLFMRDDRHAALFYSDRTRSRMSANGIQELVTAAAMRANINRHVTPHTLRHAFATNFCRNDGNMRHLQRLMGHNSLETTATYSHIVDSDLMRSYVKYHTV